MISAVGMTSQNQPAFKGVVIKNPPKRMFKTLKEAVPGIKLKGRNYRSANQASNEFVLVFCKTGENLSSPMLLGKDIDCEKNLVSVLRDFFHGKPEFANVNVYRVPDNFRTSA